MSEQQNTNNGKITKQRTQPPATATSTSNALVVPQLPTPSAAHNTIHAQFIDRTDALVISHDMNGRLLSTNNAVITTLGYHPTQLSQAYMVQLMPESEREYFRNEYLNQIKTDGKYEGRWLLNGRGGKPYHWLVYCNVITTAQQPIVICFAHDITALMNIEDALKMSNEIFRSAFDYSGMSLALISTGGIILDANKSLCSFLKYSKQELINKHFLHFIHPDDTKTDQDLLHHILIKAISHYSMEKRYLSKDKKIAWALHTVSKVSYEDGKPKFFILQLVDITKRKQLNEELNAKNKELEAARTGLVTKITQLEELNHIIAHNLRGPANNIKMLTKRLKNIDQPYDEETGFSLTLEEVAEYLEAGSNSLLNSLNTLMDMVQITMNKTIEYDNCDLNAIVADLLTQQSSVLFEKNAKVHRQIQVPFIKYPKVYLESLLYNLISNALKYSSPKRAPEIIISTYMADNRPHISVKDNGLGLDMEKHGKKLFKLNQVFHPGHDSKGVGLFITKAQIESFGGSIWVVSKEDQGAEFIVKI